VGKTNRFVRVLYQLKDGRHERVSNKLSASDFYISLNRSLYAQLHL